MELTRTQIKQTKGIAIVFMILLHLFATKNYKELFTPSIMIGTIPLTYYIGLFGDSCVAIYCFCSGYGLMLNFKKSNLYEYKKANYKRILLLYLNYWIIIILFILFIGKILGLSKLYPGNIKNLLLTITAISPKYNGAWWFITTYILLVLSSPLINKSIFNKKIIFKVFLVFIFYFVTYIQRFKFPIQTEINLTNYILKQISLFGVSLLPYFLGALFAEKMFYSKIYKYINSKMSKKWVDLGGLIFILIMMIFHGFFETVFIAPFTGIGFIISFNLINKGKWIETLLDYLSIHSTNIWLTHMFFYMIYFKKIIFYPKYPILIFVWLMIICLTTSHLINIIYFKILNKLFIKSYKKKLKIS